MRVNHAFGRAYGTGFVGEANFHLAFQFSCLDVMGIIRDLGGVPALPATAKYQLIASFVILFTAGIIHNKQPAVLGEWDVGLINDCRGARYFGTARLPDSLGRMRLQFLLISIDQSAPESILWSAA